jgi:hypothetical protein
MVIFYRDKKLSGEFVRFPTAGAAYLQGYWRLVH